MTLLEAVVALVILGLSAVGYLDLFRASAAAVHDASEWTAVVAAAETAMEGATLGDAVQAQAGLPATAFAEGLRTRVEVRPWGAGVQEVVVTVTAPSGAVFALHRLAREQLP